MRVIKLIILMSLLLLISFPLWALKGVIATPETIAQLKEDLLDGKIQIGKTRLTDVRNTYGDAPSISDTATTSGYDYGDLKLDFEKEKYLKKWEYDSFKPAAYTDDINSLRSDLESDKIVGENITFKSILQDYGQPTESMEKPDDGDLSVYYWGNIKLTFENYIVLKTWRARNFAKSPQTESAPETEKPQATPTPADKK